MTTKFKPEQLVIICDMILPITHIANWKKINDDKKILFKKNNMQ